MGDIKEVLGYILQEMGYLRKEIEILKEDLNQAKNGIISLSEVVGTQKKINSSYPAHIANSPTNSLQTPTNNWSFKPLNAKILGISSGNEGVPADRQTNQQTDRHKENALFYPKNNPLEEASDIIDSLDSIRKEIRQRFKKLTEQELVVFSAIYQIEEELGFCDYRALSQKLGLTESSIRDYVGKLIKKGIPLEKKKINNKAISLSISEKLKRVVSLSTILQLRDL